MWFAAGIALAWAHVLTTRPGGAPRLGWLVALGRQPGVCWALAFSLLVIAATPLSGPMLFETPTPAEALTRQVLYALIGGLLVLTGVFTTRSGYSRVMSDRCLDDWATSPSASSAFTSSCCTSSTGPTPYTKFQGNDLLPVLGLTMPITLPLAELLYRFVERPAMRLRHVGSATPRATPARATTHRS